ncbi:MULTISPECIES: hypothetical protein [Enterobacteriaceae]|uniref:hypothetical protein n=1 Tax=Enterobacteriaceae TaxID=543 RepID=UPI000272AE09|nr:hypothetical protein [Enterobacter sp. Ag1]EJF31673.1 hypothetical protein A936_08773 [Enterobacter sp. Ag1]
MKLKLHILSFSALLFTIAPVWAEGSGAKAICELPRPTLPRKSAQTVMPEISLVCGSNTVSQTVSMPPTPNITTVPTQSGNVPTSTSTIIALISGAAGIFGALAGGLASLYVARHKAKSDLELETKRLQANLVATERLRWLQDIRKRFSNLYSQLDMQYNFAKRTVDNSDIAIIQKQLDEMSSEIMEQCNMIMVMLNTAKPDQAKLYDVLQQVLRFIPRVFQQAPAKITNIHDKEYGEYKQAAFDAMTRLGVETWRQVKSLS